MALVLENAYLFDNLSESCKSLGKAQQKIESYSKALDKEFIRRHLVAQGYSGEGPAPELSDDIRLEAARRYVEIYEQVTGKPFVADEQQPIARLKERLSAYSDSNPNG